MAWRKIISDTCTTKFVTVLLALHPETSPALSLQYQWRQTTVYSLHLLQIQSRLYLFCLFQCHHNKNVKRRFQNQRRTLRCPSSNCSTDVHINTEQPDPVVSVSQTVSLVSILPASIGSRRSSRFRFDNVRLADVAL